MYIYTCIHKVIIRCVLEHTITYLKICGWYASALWENSKFSYCCPTVACRFNTFNKKMREYILRLL